jgi:hypothetical protein
MYHCNAVQAVRLTPYHGSYGGHITFRSAAALVSATHRSDVGEGLLVIFGTAQAANKYTGSVSNKERLVVKTGPSADVEVVMHCHALRPKCCLTVSSQQLALPRHAAFLRAHL